MEKTINQIEDKLYEILSNLDDFMDKYHGNIKGRAYELFFKTFSTVDDVLDNLNSMRNELENGKENE